MVVQSHCPFTWEAADLSPLKLAQILAYNFKSSMKEKFVKITT